MIEILIGLAIVVFSGAAGFVGDRMAGSGKKITGYGLIGFGVFLPALFGAVTIWHIPVWSYPILYAACYLAALSLRKWFIWGPLFMHDKRGPVEKKHSYIYDWAESITKFDYLTCTEKQLVVFKMTMWMLRYCVAGLLAASIIGFFNATIMPFFMLPVLGLARSYIYRLEYLQDSSTQLEESEPDSGLTTLALMAASRL